jgi:hypothetical protein
VRIGATYARSVRCLHTATRVNLEQLFINRFGRELYKTFFKFCTETQMTLKHETGMCRRFGLRLAVVRSDTRKRRELPAITRDLSYAGEAFT